MRLFSFVRGAIRHADFFSSTELLRFQGDLQYHTLTGGILSIAILATVIIGFASMILDTLSLDTITMQKIISQASDPTPLDLAVTPESNFMFGFSINSINLSAPIRYFDIYLELYQQSNTIIQERVELPLQQCTLDHWAKFPNLLAKFQAVQVGNWLCPPIGTPLHLQGSYTSTTYSQYMIRVTSCHNQTDPSRPCASKEQILAQSFNNKSFYYFNFYYSNPIINADQKDFISYYLEDQTYVIFGDSMATENYLYISDYTINTDQSIWPYQKQQQTTGAIIEDPDNKCSFQTTENGPYVLFNLVKSHRSIIYNRSVQKISQVFSFIGGLVSAIYTVLFIVKKYACFAYQLSIAGELFQSQEVQQNECDNVDKQEKYQKDNKTKSNIFEFCKYWVYFLSVKVGKAFSWPKMAQLQNHRDEILQQLDVKILLKRLIFMEHCMTYVFEDFQLSGLQMRRPTSYSEIKQLREKCESVARSFASSDDQQLSQKVPEDDNNKQQRNSSDMESPLEISSRKIYEKKSSIRILSKRTVLSKQPSILIFDMPSNNEDLMFDGNKVKNLCNLTRQNKRQERLFKELADKARMGDIISKKILGNIINHRTNLKIEEISVENSK